MPGKIMNYLNRPFPLLLSKKQGWLYIGAMVLVIDLLVILQQPFGIVNWHHSDKLIILSVYGILFAFIYANIYFILSPLFPRFYNRDTWTFSKEVRVLLFFFPLVGLVNWMYTLAAISEFPFSFFSFLQIQFYTFITDIIPVFSILFYMENRYLLRHRKISEEEDISLLPIHPPFQSINHIQIKNFRLSINEILFIESNRNDLTIHLLRDGKVFEKTIRYTLKELEPLLTDYPQFQRCHLSYIVNMEWVVNYEGDLSKMQLYLQNYKPYIPVSRSYTHQVKNILSS